MKAYELVNKIEEAYPKTLAESFDPVGLQIGDLNKEIKSVLVTLDVRPEVVQEAIEKEVDFIFSHHPVMFRPAKNLDLSNPQNKMYADLICHGIVVYSAHTNFDKAENGMNDWLAEKLGLSSVLPLVYEDESDKHGLGRTGYLDQEIAVKDFCQQLKDIFAVEQIRLIANDENKKVQKVAVIGGDGGKYWPEAKAQGCEVLVTADLYYHVGHDVLANDFMVIDPDHHMEAIFKKRMAEQIWNWQIEYAWDLEYIDYSKINTDPYKYV